jgi:hypothetical protein
LQILDRVILALRKRNFVVNFQAGAMAACAVKDTGKRIALHYVSERPMAPASRFSQNANDINDPSAIRTSMRQERPERGEVRPRPRTCGERTGKARRTMIGYM